MSHRSHPCPHLTPRQIDWRGCNRRPRVGLGAPIHHGYTPIAGNGGSLDPLNGGLVAAPTVGPDVDADAISWNTSYGPFYADTGAAGVGTFRHDTAWAPYVPAIELSAI